MKGLTFLLLLGALIWAFATMKPTMVLPHMPVTLAFNTLGVHVTLAFNTSGTTSGTHVTLQDAEAVQGDPSLSAAFVDKVLTAAHSPARGIGSVIYQLSQKYHLDDAFALAFYHHESLYGTVGVAVTTHSWGNIRCTQGWTCDSTGGYRAYASYAAAAQDWYQLIATDYVAQRGLTTVSTIIPTYAPTTDNNNEAAYIQSVLADVLAFRQGKVQA